MRDQTALAESANAQREVERLSRALADAQSELQRLRTDVDAERQGLARRAGRACGASCAGTARTPTGPGRRRAARPRTRPPRSRRRSARLQAAEQRAERAEAELGRSREALEALRRADREGRSLAGSRARLLLDTVVEAATGLRRELGLAPADVLPADLVGESAGDGACRRRPRRPCEPAPPTTPACWPSCSRCRAPT